MGSEQVSLYGAKIITKILIEFQRDRIMESDSLSPAQQRMSTCKNEQTTAKARTCHKVSAQSDAHEPKYNMDGNGLCLIINNKRFINPKLNRSGAEVDERRLVSTFKNLDYDVWVRRNLNSDDLEALPSTIAKTKNFKNYKILIFVVMSHGGPGKVYGTDDISVNILRSIEHPFQSTNCPTLAGKPKLFFYQACRGNRNQQRSTVVADDGSARQMRHWEATVTRISSLSTPPLSSSKRIERFSQAHLQLALGLSLNSVMP